MRRRTHFRVRWPPTQWSRNAIWSNLAPPASNSPKWLSRRAVGPHLTRKPWSAVHLTLKMCFPPAWWRRL